MGMSSPWAERAAFVIEPENHPMHHRQFQQDFDLAKGEGPS
jgi:hypothetical protein